MKFEKEALFKELVKKHGMNLYLGAGFSVYAYNNDNVSLPLGNDINKKLIELFGLDKERKLSLGKTCQKVKKDNADMLEKVLKETYTVKNFDIEYVALTRLPIKSIVTINIDDLVEKIFNNNESTKNISDTKIYGSLERDNVVNLYKLHGSVTYPFGSDMSFTEKELMDLFVRDGGLFNTVTYKLSVCPTIFWGTSLTDSNTLELISNSEKYSRSIMPKWLVVYPEENNKGLIEDFRDLGFYIIEADTKELINYLNYENYGEPVQENNYIFKRYRDTFPSNFICKELKKSGVRRPVIDFFAGAEPQISDICSSNVSRTSYYANALEVILTGEVTLLTGIPGCGKSTLLMQLAFSDDIDGRKFWFNSIIRSEAERLVEIVKHDKNVVVFIDNLYNNIDALQVLKDAKNIKLVLAERALNFEYVKRFLSISTDRILDISNLFSNDIQNICKSMNRSSGEAIDLMKQNENISLLEIVFFASVNAKIHERIKKYIEDLQKYSDSRLKINLLELFALVNYTSYCGIPISMDMLYFYFSESIENYNDIIFALDKMSQIIVESEDINAYEENQNYMVIRSKLFAEKSLNLIPEKVMAQVLENFLDRISIQVIYRYDIFKRRAYDADITKRAFNVTQGITFYETLLENNKSPYIRHQYALFLQRKDKIDLAWKQIDQAYTDSKKKIFSIANTHAIILFEMNMVNQTSDTDIELFKTTIEKSFSTLEFCITQDVRVNYHVLTYARNTIRYYEKYGFDEYAERYIQSALNQLNIILTSGEYIFRGTFRELKSLQSELYSLKVII